MKEISLLKQAEIYLKDESLRKRLEFSRKKALNSAEIIKALLPQYEPGKKQNLFHSSEAFEKGIKGGYRSGKTHALIAEGIALAYINRPYAGMLVSPSYDAAVEILAEKLESFCIENALDYDFFISKGLFEIRFGFSKKDIGKLYLHGGDKPRFLKGRTRAFGLIDEPFSMSKEVYDIVLSRISEGRARLNRLIWAGTPEPNYMTWGYEYFEEEHDSKKLLTITIPTKDNEKNLPKDYISNLEAKYDERMREAFLEGKYINLSCGKVYHSFNKSINVFEPAKNETNYSEVIVSFDFNVDPMSAVVILFSNKKFRQIKEFKINSSNTAETAKAVCFYLSETLKINNKSVIITGDASGRKRGTRSNYSDYDIIFNIFCSFEILVYFRVPKENPSVRDRVNYVNVLFEAGLFEINKECKYSIRDRELVAWKNSGEGFIIDKSKKELTHLSDAGDYGVYNCQILSDTENEAENSLFYAERPKR